MTQPTSQPESSPQRFSPQAWAESHSFRSRATREGDLLDIIRDLRKRVEKLEAQVNTH